MVDFLNEKLGDVVEIVLMPTVETAKLCVQDIRAAENDDDCVGVITWMHTFSPANVIAGIRRFAEVAKAIDLSRDLTVATFGNNMRDVAVTDGNRQYRVCPRAGRL